MPVPVWEVLIWGLSRQVGFSLLYMPVIPVIMLSVIAGHSVVGERE